MDTILNLIDEFEDLNREATEMVAARFAEQESHELNLRDCISGMDFRIGLIGDDGRQDFAMMQIVSANIRLVASALEIVECLKRGARIPTTHLDALDAEITEERCRTSAEPLMVLAADILAANLASFARLSAMQSLPIGFDRTVRIVNLSRFVTPMIVSQ